MKKQWSMIGAIILLLIAVLFSWMNSQSVTVNFGFSKVTMPLVVILVISLLLGALIAVLISTTAYFRQKKQIKSLQKQLAANQTMRRQPETTAEAQIGSRSEEEKQENNSEQ